MRLKDLREDHDLPQKHLAAELHISQNTYSQYETGTRQLPIDIPKASLQLRQGKRFG